MGRGQQREPFVNAATLGLISKLLSVREGDRSQALFVNRGAALNSERDWASLELVHLFL